MNPEISIIIPCLNEEKTLPIVLRKAQRTFERLKVQGEIIVSDNGSTDKSRKVAESHGAKVIDCPKKGYGHALQEGLKAARGKYLIMGDADDSYNFEELDEYIETLRRGYDIAIGNRLQGKIEKGAMPWLHRYLGTPVLSLIIRKFFKIKVSDCNCGMRGITKKAFENLQLESGGMEFASEMIIKAGIQKMKTKEFPVNFYRDKRDRAPHLNTWRDGWRHLKFILMYAPNYLFIYPGVTLFVMGSLLLVPQANGPFRWGMLYMDIHFMILGLTLSLVGLFATQMGLIIKLYSSQSKYYRKNRLINWFRNIPIEKELLLGTTLIIIGIVIDIYILIIWISHDFANIFLPHRAILSLYLVFTGVSIIFFAFFKAILNNHE